MALVRMYVLKVISWIPHEQCDFHRERTFRTRATTMSEHQVPTAVAQCIVIRF